MDRVFPLRIRSLLGPALSVVCLAFALRNIHFGQIRNALGGVNYPYLVLAMGAVTAAVVATALRWKALFYPYSGLSTNPFVSVAFIGELANTFLPARLGSIVRVLLIGERVNVSRAFALGTVIVEKIFEGLLLIAVLGLLSPFTPFPDWPWQLGLLTLVVVAMLLVSGMALEYGKHRLSGIVSRLSKHLPIFSNLDLARELGYISESFDALRPARAGWAPWAWSGVIAGLGIFANHMTLLAVNIQVSLVVPILLMVVLQIGRKVPSLPANVGVFEYLCVLSLSFFSVDPSLALTFGVLLHVVALLPPTLLGVVYLWREKAGFQTLRHMATRSENGVALPETGT